MKQWTTITSKENQQIKLAAKLSSKKERQQQGRFLAEGLRLCLDALRGGLQPIQVFVTEEWREKGSCEPLLQAAEEGFLISDEIAQKLAETQNTQGIFCSFALPSESFCWQEGRLNQVLILSSLQDPGNIGTIIRTAEAFQIDLLILSADCPDLYSPKLLRGTMGGIFRIKTAIEPDLCAVIAKLRASNIAVYAAALQEESLPITQVKFDKPSAIVIGNEGNGLAQSIIEACTASIKIPMPGRAESLNAAVAASIAIWEMARQETCI